jgi:hypothetical protein
MDEHRDERNWKYTMLGNFRIVYVWSRALDLLRGWDCSYVMHWIWLPLKIIKYDASLYVTLPITSSCFPFLCLLVCTLSSQLSLKPIQFVFFNGFSSYAVYRVQNRTRISCYKRRVHSICILVFEIGGVRECVAVVCGVWLIGIWLKHYCIKIIVCVWQWI